ncbi:hypothetical protein GGI07_004449 [Coemansia sp. Benny D115]|nr:hypothetical protein GGI07_004449 [Coemansia sp. Benny D115]
MDGYRPAAATIIEHILPYLDSKDVAACRAVNRVWHALATVHSARDVDCHILRLPLRLAHFKRKKLAGAIRSLTIDIGFVEGFLSPAMYERRICDAVSAVHTSGAAVRRLKLHMPTASSSLTSSELRYGLMACSLLLRELPQLLSLDLSECPAALLAGSDKGADMFCQQRLLRQIRWFALGSNDMSSAATLARLVEANQPSLRTVHGFGDVTDHTLALLANAPNLQRLDASGSSVSDKALLDLVRARGSNLRNLILSDCTRLTHRSIAQLTPQALPRLAVLDLYNVMVTTDSYQHLFNASTFWPYLRDLRLKAAIPHTSPRQDSLVNDDILEAIGSNCPRLSSLRLFGCHGITDDGLSAILGNLGNLRELVVMHNAAELSSDAAAAAAAASEPTVSAARAHSPQQAPLEQPSTSSNALLLSLPSISDIWASIPSLPSNALAPQPLPSHAAPPAQRHHVLRSASEISPPSTAPSSPCVSGRQHQAQAQAHTQRQRRQPHRNSSGARVFTSDALRNGVRSKRFNLLNLDMEYDSACAEHLARLTHLHVLCGRMITRHAKSLIESQFPKCKMMVWNID